ncbi:hypothetical protein LTR53_012685 [Teratosphaeriaceae sp. CCFEE 6253]|nr:hypothetical protein LTR53_012685 [Teratosphaeriaceae sp. CCFEE 6253]
MSSAYHADAFIIPPLPPQPGKSSRNSSPSASSSASQHEQPRETRAMAASPRDTKTQPLPKILIVGAGPSGLLLALLLAQRGIPSIVLEAWSSLDTRLRAVQYGVPATRLFRRAGLLPDIRAASIPKFSAICWRRTADGAKLAEIDMSLVEDEEDRMTVLPLGEIIQIMYKHCTDTERGRLIDIRFSHKVIGTGQDQTKAWADVDVGEEGGEQKRERITAEYLIGCDGAGSAVRKSLFGQHWPGVTFDCRFMVQNIRYDGFEEHGWEGGNYMVDREHWGLVARRGHGGLWRVTYGDPVPGLTDEKYLERREWHLKAMLPGHPDPDQYCIESNNLYNIHNRCVDSFKVGRILLAADAAHICNPMGGYGCMTACLDVGGLADCFIGLFEGLAGEEILEVYAEVRRDIFLRYVDARSIKNLDRVSRSDPWTVAETDPFFRLIGELNEDKAEMKKFLMKVSSIEYDFTRHYHKHLEKRSTVDGVAEVLANGVDGAAVEVAMHVEAA